MQNTIKNGKRTKFHQQILTQQLIKSSLVMMLVAQGQKSSIQKLGGYTVSLNHSNTVSAEK
jgi:maltose phosphorylase